MNSSAKSKYILPVIFTLIALSTFTYVLIHNSKEKKEEQVEITDPTSLYIKIDKSSRTLQLFEGETLVKKYTVALGFAPLGDKEIEGDGKTPEGEFYICMKNPNSKYHLSLGISYPNKEDASRGKSQNLISEQEYSAINQAIESGKKPLWNTALGGEIFIHGKGASNDWTFGCIALENSDIEELFALIELGILVQIDA
ncbi:MAG: murein L,D-transpeptidase YafK [Limisphaerales bacterium]|jgi:murein L,D-transpeptidase YafK